MQQGNFDELGLQALAKEFLKDNQLFSNLFVQRENSRGIENIARCLAAFACNIELRSVLKRSLINPQQLPQSLWTSVRIVGSTFGYSQLRPALEASLSSASSPPSVKS